MSRKARPPKRVGRRPGSGETGLTEFSRAVRRRVPALVPQSDRRIRLLRAKQQRNGRLARAFREMDEERGDG